METPQPNITRADAEGFHVECPACRSWITVPLEDVPQPAGGYQAEPDMTPYEQHYQAEHA
jgi:hypothetical protein